MDRRWVLRLAAPASVVVALTLSVPRLLTFGATAEEARDALPGDDEVPGAQLQGTRAVTIDAPPGEVWPWIAQIGHHRLGRAGWYAFDLADNDGVPSAWEIIPEPQRPQLGQVIGEEGFAVRAVEVDQLLLLSYHYPKPDWVLKQGLWPRFGSCSWVFVLRPLQEGRTRLIARTRYRVDRLDLSAPFWPLFLVADLASQPTMLRGIKRRAELTSSRAHTHCRRRFSRRVAGKASSAEWVNWLPG